MGVNQDSGVRYEAEVTDPITGEVCILYAADDEELEQLIEEHLRSRYPVPALAQT